MEKFIIKGGKKIKGEVKVSGAKNVALKVLIAACLTDQNVVIKNIPLISDLMVMIDIIKELGGEVEIKDHSVSIKIKKINSTKIPLDKAAGIRTSFMFIVPLLLRNGSAVIPNPGGCRIGARPIDRIIDGIKKMGVNVYYNSADGYLHAKIKKLKGVNYRFEKSTHTGTETLLLLATLAEGKTVLKNAGQEPEIDELISFINLMGGDVKRVNSRTIIINGVKKLHGLEFKINPDRNEIVTFAIAAIMTKGEIFIKNINDTGLKEFLEKLKEVGGGFEIKKEGIKFFYKNDLKATKIMTSPYPGFMTDWQSSWAVLMTKASGISIINETVYENRFGYVNELEKMGAHIKLFNPKITHPEKFYNFNLNDDRKEYFHAIKIEGPVDLHNGIVHISDLRAGATLVLAALAAKGESIIYGIEHLDRGYEKFEERLKNLGADIERVKEE